MFSAVFSAFFSGVFAMFFVFLFLWVFLPLKSFFGWPHFGFWKGFRFENVIRPASLFLKKSPLFFTSPVLSSALFPVIRKQLCCVFSSKHPPPFKVLSVVSRGNLHSDLYMVLRYTLYTTFCIVFMPFFFAGLQDGFHNNSYVILCGIFHFFKLIYATFRTHSNVF